MTKSAAAKKTTTEQATVQCACECGEATQSAKSNYRPGHDARHASNVGRFLATSNDPEANNRALASLGSDKLRTKALAMDSRLRALAAAKAEREAAKANKPAKASKPAKRAEIEAELRDEPRPEDLDEDGQLTEREAPELEDDLLPISEIKVGRWTYPVRRSPEDREQLQRNTKTNGTGSWINV